MQKYSAKFTFFSLSNAENGELPGSVVIDASGKMTLSCYDGDLQYRIEGQSNPFGGIAGQDVQNDVRAAWSRVNLEWITGLWVEEGYQFMFSAKMRIKPKKQARRP